MVRVLYHVGVEIMIDSRTALLDRQSNLGLMQAGKYGLPLDSIA